jgi:adenylate cyclase
MADVLTFDGRADQAVELIREAMQLDPHHPSFYWQGLGMALFVARRYEEAVTAIRHRPSLQCTEHVYLAACHAQLGEDEAIRASAAEVRRLRPDFSIEAFSARDYFKLATDREHLASSLRKAGLPE